MGLLDGEEVGWMDGLEWELGLGGWRGPMGRENWGRKEREMGDER